MNICCLKGNWVLLVTRPQRPASNRPYIWDTYVHSSSVFILPAMPCYSQPIFAKREIHLTKHFPNTKQKVWQTLLSGGKKRARPGHETLAEEWSGELRGGQTHNALVRRWWYNALRPPSNSFSPSFLCQLSPFLLIP